jgi:hypothetical protein
MGAAQVGASLENPNSGPELLDGDPRIPDCSATMRKGFDLK